MKGEETKRKLHPLMWAVIGLTAASFILLLVGTLLPPQGEVHPSLLKGLGIISVDVALVNFSYAIVSGKVATFTHGKTSATVGGRAKTETEKKD